MHSQNVYTFALVVRLHFQVALGHTKYVAGAMKTRNNQAMQLYKIPDFKGLPWWLSEGIHDMGLISHPGRSHMPCGS